MNKIRNVIGIIAVLLFSFMFVFSNTTETETFDPSIYETKDSAEQSNSEEAENFDPSKYEENATSENLNKNQQENQENSSSSFVDTRDSQQVIVSERTPERIVPLAIYGSITIILIIGLLLYSIHYYRKKRSNSNPTNVHQK